MALSPGFPLRGEAGSQNSVCCRSRWQSPGNAPATRVGAGTLRYTPLGLASQERAKGPSPSPAAAPLASSPISKACDPGFGTLSSPERAPAGRSARQPGKVGKNLLGSRPEAPIPTPAQARRDPRLRGALTDPDDVGHPARVRDPEGAHEEPGPVFPNQSPEAPPGSGHRWAPPSVPGARPWRAPWGGSSRRGLAAAPEAPPGPAARLPSAAASGGRPAAPRTSYWGAAQPAPAPPGCRPRAARSPGSRAPPELRPDSALARVGSAPARAPTCPGCRALAGGLHASPAAPPPAATDAIARALTKPRSGVARAHTLPPSPLPRALPPASRATRRPRSLRALPRAHTLHTHTRRGYTRTLTPVQGAGKGTREAVWGDARRTRALLDSQTSPSALQPPVPSTARARSRGAGRGARELAPGAGRRRPPRGPTSWRRRACRERRHREPAVCSLAFQLARRWGWLDGVGRRLPREPVSLPNPIPHGLRAGAGALGD